MSKSALQNDIWSQILSSRKSETAKRRAELIKRMKFGGTVNVKEDGTIEREKAPDMEALAKATPAPAATPTPSAAETPVTTDPTKPLEKAGAACEVPGVETAKEVGQDTTVVHDEAEMKNAGIAVFVPFSKVNKNKDGSVTVSGIASKQEVDSDGDIMMFSAIEDALPAWLEFGNIREMHQLSAVGTLTDHKMMTEEKALWIEVKVVDAEAVKKVLNGVYKGFSLGGNILAVDPLEGVDNHGMMLRWRITKIRLNEISLVDKPASPSALIDMIKAGKQMGEVKKSFVMEAGELPLTKLSAVDTLKASHFQVTKSVKVTNLSTSLLSKLQSMSNPTTLEKAVKSATEALLEKGVDLSKAAKAELDNSQIAELITLGAEHGLAMAKADGGEGGGEGAGEGGAPAAPAAPAADAPAAPAAGADVTKAVKTPEATAQPDLAKAIASALKPLADAVVDMGAKLEKATQGKTTQTPEELRKAADLKKAAEGSFKNVFIR